MSLLADLFNNPLIPKYEVKDYGLFCEGKFYEDMRLTCLGFTGPCPVRLPTLEGELNPEELLRRKLSGEPIPQKKVVVPAKQVIFNVETEEERIAIISLIDKITTMYSDERFELKTWYNQRFGVLPQYKERSAKLKAQRYEDFQAALTEIRDIVSKYNLVLERDEDGEVDDEFGLDIQKDYPKEWIGHLCTGTITLLYTISDPNFVPHLDTDLLNLQRGI